MIGNGGGDELVVLWRMEREGVAETAEEAGGQHCREEGRKWRRTDRGSEVGGMLEDVAGGGDFGNEPRYMRFWSLRDDGLRMKEGKA